MPPKPASAAPGTPAASSSMLSEPAEAQPWDAELDAFRDDVREELDKARADIRAGVEDALKPLGGQLATLLNEFKRMQHRLDKIDPHHENDDEEEPVVLSKTIIIPEAPSSVATAPSTPTASGTFDDTAPWTKGREYKQRHSATPAMERSSSMPSAPTAAIHFESASAPTDGGTRPQQFTIKTDDIGTFDGVPEELELFIARIEAVASVESDPGWARALVRAIPMALRRVAALWHATLKARQRAALTSLAKWIRALRFEFSAPPAQMRQIARDRAWDVDAEDALSYVFAKTALMRFAFPSMEDADLVQHVAECVPTDIRRFLRSPANPDATLSDLRYELRDQEYFWRMEHDKPLTPHLSNDGANSRLGRVSDLLQPAKRDAAAGTRTPNHAPGQRASSPTTPTARRFAPAPASGGTGSSRPRGKPISEDFDGSRLAYGTHPDSGRRMMSYKIPGTSKTMWCQRPCGRCGGDHFDFAHDWVQQHPGALHVTTAAEDDYLITGESDGEGEVADPSADGSARSSPIHCDPPPGLAAEGCKSDVKRVASASGPGQELHVGYSKPVSDDSVPPSQQPPHSRDASTPSIHFANRPQFFTSRSVGPAQADQPLAHPTKRTGTVVTLSPHPATGSGQAYRHHVPLTTQIRVNDSGSPLISSLLDTGASLSSIDADLLDRLGGHATGQPMRINGLGVAHTLGWATITFFVPARDAYGREVHLECTHDFHVIRDFAPGLCLGLDFIQAQGVTIDARSNRACTGRYTFAVHERMPAPFATEAELCTSQAAFLPPGAYTWVAVDSACLEPGTDYTIHPRVTVSPDEDVQIAGPAALTTGRVGRILLANVGTKGIHLARRTPVADAVAARLGDISAPSAHTLDLGPPLPPGATTTAFVQAGSWSLGSDGSYSDDTPAAPLDPFTPEPGDVSSLTRDAQTTLVDDHFRIGVDADGRPPPAVVETLRRHREAFSLDGRPGLVRGEEMGIRLEEGATLHPEAPRRVSPEKQRAMDDTIDQLLDWNVIEPSSSPVSFPVLMVRQHQKWRFCVDYRQLNASTVADRYPLPRVDSVFQSLLGKKVFSSLDALRGYHQTSVRESDRWKTAFICHRGLFQYRTVPFGLRNAPAFFQRVMDKLLGALRWKDAVVYIDDIVVATVTLEEHVRALDTLLSRARDIGLRFSPAKCTFAVSSLTLLGRKVSGAGVAVWADRAKAVEDLPRPRTLQDLYAALGLLGYYRAFIPGYAAIAEPLTRLTKGWRYDCKDGRAQLVRASGEPAVAHKTILDWGDPQQRSFDALKQAISRPPVLAHPDPSRPYVLYVDASKHAFAAILHQVFVKEEPVADVTAAASVHTLASAPVPLSVSTDQWRSWLRADPALRTALRQAQAPKEKDWILRDGFLVRRSDGRYALPEAAIAPLLRAIHDQGGHFGFTKTYLAVAQHFWRPRLVETIQAWIRHCPTCVASRPAPKAGSLRIDDDPQSPFEAISVDLVLGLPRTRAGNDAFLLIVDLFSRMVIIEPCSAAIDAPGIVRVIEDRVMRWGWRPRRLVSDSEAKMTGTFMRALADSLSARLTPSPPHHQQANAVERAVQTVQATMKRLSLRSHAHWDREVAPAVEVAMNASPNVTTGYRPFDLVFVAHPPLTASLQRNPEPDGTSAFSERLAAASARLEEARAAIAEARVQRKQRYDSSRATPPPYHVDDEAYIRLRDRPVPGTPSHKLASAKLGPFRVKAVLSDHRVRLSLPPELSIGDEFSVEQLDRVPGSPDPFALSRITPPPGAAESTPPAPQASDLASAPSVPSPAALPRRRVIPSALRDFDLGTADADAALPPELLQGPIFRPREVSAHGRAVTLLERPIAFLSRLTSVTEKKMVAAELELSCLAWAFAQWAHLLEGASVTIVTDHAPLPAMLTSSAQHYGPTITRCRALLLPHLQNMRFVHRAGRTHTNVDSLSRLPLHEAVDDPGRSSS